MLTQEECKELVLRSPFTRRRPTAEFVSSRIANRVARVKQGIKTDPDNWRARWDEHLSMAGAASYFNLVLDTTAPGGSSAAINGGASYTTSVTVSLAVTTSDSPTTGYQIIVYGAGVDNADNASIQTTEGASSWITPTWTAGVATQSVKVSTGDGSKSISCKIRDDVWNETSAITNSITLDTTVPVVTIGTGPDVTKISKVSGKRVVTFIWQVDVATQAYEVAVVSASGSIRGSGTVVLTTNGSTNVSGGSTAATTNKTTTIDGRDLEVASAGDGTKVVKVFAQDLAGNWSTA